MNRFSEFLYARRKELKLTQQNIADRLGVSNKAVSKWETGDSFPETAQLVPLADILHCTVDEMLHGELASRQPAAENRVPDAGEESCSPQSEAEKAEKGEPRPLKVWQGICIAVGLFLILSGVAALMIYVFLKGEEERVALQGTAILLFFLSAAVFLFVFAGLSHDVTDRVNEAQKPRAKLYSAGMGISIGVIIAAVSIVLLYPSAVGAAVMIAVMGLAVAFIVLCGVGIARFRLPGQKNVGDRWSGVIMLTATVIFLLCGFLWNLWHPAWVVFPVGGILCGIVSEIGKAVRGNKENKDKED